jgi:geranylgeranylglycerol-phosphate geranylgeranyltransferase
MGRAKTFFRLTRPQNNLITAISVFIGAWVCEGIPSVTKLILACMSAFLISAGGYVINDYFDVEIDKINRPSRPLITGEISKKTALSFSLTLFFLGLFLSSFIKFCAILVALFSSLALIYYSFKLKNTLFWGNFIVSLICALAFVYGGIVGKDLRWSLIPAIFAYLFHFGREILKDMEDKEGDQLSGAKTIPILLGVKPSLFFISFVFSVLIALTFFPYIFKIFSISYLLVVLIFDLLLLYVIWSLWRDWSTENLGRLSRILKVDMILGLAAIFLGRF